ncbi:hypothetical protein SAMN05216456_2930 [Devosia crocina]|uniref:Uncharacterized protein n=1 Tax=Devosia crocina TaxID=429728 RepID=A0A1I7NS13_9HYPH|nr:hypothetical protein SAMN05216456_2930 [Devosia crocina]
MCEQCQGFDDEDVDALAAAFVARRAATQKSAATSHALLYRRAPVVPATKEKPNG